MEPVNPPKSETYAELLLAYQGVVVHDLRGDLNGLLLTVDFLRRQLGTRPDIAGPIGETLGDLDSVRDSLTRTLNQLDMVGYARRTVTGRAAPEHAEQNVTGVVAATLQDHVADSARRRNLVIEPPQKTDLAVKADPVLLQLVIQRMLMAMTEAGRQTKLRLAVEKIGDDRVAICATFADPNQFPPDLYDRAATSPPSELKPGAAMALALAIRMAEQMGGVLRKNDPERGGGLCLELPTNGA